MTRRQIVLAVLLSTLAAGGPVVAQSNPFVGTWKLNLAKSKFNPGPAPRSQTRTWAADGTVSVEGVSAAGTPVAYGYAVTGDGKAYPTTGAVPGAPDALSSTRINASTVEAHFTKGGKPTDTTTFMVSSDGKVLTITAKGTLPDGTPLNDLLAYDKQ